MPPIIDTAMIMAAGHGTRMMPLTRHRAKAMVKVDGKALIDHILARLKTAGIRRVIVNVHAHADHLQAHLAQIKHMQIIISDERATLMDTGGALVKALPDLGSAPIFICNIDSLWVEHAPVLPAMCKFWDEAKMDELLLLARPANSLGYSGAGDFDREANGHLHYRQRTRADYIYAGVQIFKPELARPFPCDPFPRRFIWNKSLQAKKFYGLEMKGVWMHVGTPQARQASEDYLRQICSTENPDR